MPAFEPPTSLLTRLIALVAVLRGWLSQMNVRRATHRLRVDEFASLGEKRFVAVVHFENERFLIGGAGGSVSLLAKLSRGTTNFASTISACLDK